MEFGSCDLGTTVLSVCPGCRRPNFSLLNWCTVCGCLLIDGPYNNVSHHFYDPQNLQPISCATSLSPCNDVQGQRALAQVGKASPYFLDQEVPLSRKPMAYASVQDESDSLCVNESYLPFRPQLQLSTNGPGEIPNYPLKYIRTDHFIPAKLLRYSRHRYVSSPCDDVLESNQRLRNPFWRNFSDPSSVILDSGSEETVRSDHSCFPILSSQILVPCRNTNPPSAYPFNAHFLNQSVGQLSRLLMNCSTTSRTCGELLGPRQNGDRRGFHRHNMQNFCEKSGQTQGQARSCRNKGLSKRVGRNYSEKIFPPTRQRFFEKQENDSLPVARHWQPRGRFSCSGGRNLPDALPNISKVVTNQESNNLDSSFIGASGASDSLERSDNDLLTYEDGSIYKSNWLRLPTELWYHIVRLLPYSDRASLAKTCRRLSSVVADRNNWLVIRLDRYHHLTDLALTTIGRKKPRQLHLTYCRGDAITNRGIDQLFVECGKSLEFFSFIGCSKGAFQGDYPLLASTLHCPNLCHIDASYARTVCDQTVRAIAEGSVALRTLLLNGAQNISNSAIEHLVRHHKHTLERLELFGCFHLNSRIFTTLEECHGLRALAFGFLHHLSSNGLLNLVSKLPLLASLDLRGTQKLVTDTILSRLAKECPLLEEVVLANMSSLTREESVIKMLHQLPRLRVLDLCGLAVIGDNTLQALATSCPLLEELDISCTSVTEAGLLFLANAPATSLKSLRINFCPRITATAIEKLVNSCPKLVQISLYGFSWIEKWDFLSNLRSNLIIQAETR